MTTPSPLWECPIFRRHYFLRGKLDYLHLCPIGIAQELIRTTARILGPEGWKLLNERAAILSKNMVAITKDEAGVTSKVSFPRGAKLPKQVIRSYIAKIRHDRLLDIGDEDNAKDVEDLAEELVEETEPTAEGAKVRTAVCESDSNGR